MGKINKNKFYLVGCLVLFLALILVVPTALSAEVEEAEEMKEVNLYFADMMGADLVQEAREVGKEDLYLNIVKELLLGPDDEELIGVIPYGS